MRLTHSLVASVMLTHSIVASVRHTHSLAASMRFRQRMHIYLEKLCGHSNPIASSTVYTANWKLNPHPTRNLTLPFVSETHFQLEVLDFRLYLPRPQALSLKMGEERAG